MMNIWSTAIMAGFIEKQVSRFGWYIIEIFFNQCIHKNAPREPRVVESIHLRLGLVGLRSLSLKFSQTEEIS